MRSTFSRSIPKPSITTPGAVCRTAQNEGKFSPVFLTGLMIAPQNAISLKVTDLLYKGYSYVAAKRGIARELLKTPITSGACIHAVFRVNLAKS